MGSGKVSFRNRKSSSKDETAAAVDILLVINPHHHRWFMASRTMYGDEKSIVVPRKGG